MIRIQLLRLRLSALCRFIAPWPFEVQRQPLLAVKPVNPFVVIAPIFPSEYHVYAAVTVMHPGFGDLADAQAQRTVIGSRGMRVVVIADSEPPEISFRHINGRGRKKGFPQAAALRRQKGPISGFCFLKTLLARM